MKWSLEVYDEYLIIRGAISMDDLVMIIENLTASDWVMDMDEARKNDCNFYLSSRKLFESKAKNANNQ